MQAKILFLSLIISFGCFGQTPPDSLGFTNKAEAKNLMVNGLKEGKWVLYRNISSGKFTTDTNFYDEYRLIIYHLGKPIGMARLCNWDGKIWKETPYSEGKKKGIEREYSLDGVLDGETTYNSGKKDGVAKEYYYHSLKLKSETSYNNDIESGIRKFYYENGVLKSEIQITNGKENGIKKGYYDNGQLRSETPYANGNINGIEIIYDKSGQILTENHYSMGKANGIIKLFYENSRLESETPYANAKENGIRKLYYDDGVPERETPFTNGILNGMDKEYFVSGKLKFETPYTYNIRNGVAKEYFENGNLKEEWPYNNDKRNGLDKKYYENGKLMEETLFTNGIEGASKYFDNKGNTITLEQMPPSSPGFNWSDTAFKIYASRIIKITYALDGECTVTPCYEMRKNHFVYDTLIGFLKDHPSIEIEIASYYNRWRSKTRDNGILINDDSSQKSADYMKQVLIDKGISGDRILPIGYGNKNPILPENEMKKLTPKEQGIARYHNIRIEIIIIGL